MTNALTNCTDYLPFTTFVYGHYVNISVSNLGVHTEISVFTTTYSFATVIGPLEHVSLYTVTLHKHMNGKSRYRPYSFRVRRQYNDRRVMKAARCQLPCNNLFYITATTFRHDLMWTVP
jgi:hypothetical protein